VTRDTVHGGHAAFEDHSVAGVEYQGEPRCSANSVHLANEAGEEKLEVAKLDLHKVGIFSPFREALFQV
jgi:hypothetical protein